MQKRVLLCTSLLVLTAGPLLAQGDARGEAKATVAGKSIVIDYGRPSLQGRDMLGKAEIGQAWRMGKDSPTTLTTEADLRFGNEVVPKGSYVLRATKVAEDKWQLNVLKKDDQGKVADVPLTGTKLPASVETLTIELKGEKEKGEFEMKWGTTGLKTSFTAK
jgi:Protein of unknown function (DUF2911)